MSRTTCIIATKTAETHIQYLALNYINDFRTFLINQNVYGLQVSVWNTIVSEM